MVRQRPAHHTLIPPRKRFLKFVLAVLIGLWASTLLLKVNAEISPCGNPPFLKGPIEPTVFVFTCLGFVILGRLVAYRFYPDGPIFVTERPQHEDDGNVIDDASEAAYFGELVPVTTVRSAVWVQNGLATLLTFSIAGLAYETSAVWDGNMWAITDYIRCANVVGSLQTLLIACALSFLLSTWMWYPRGHWAPEVEPVAIGILIVTVIMVGVGSLRSSGPGEAPTSVPQFVLPLGIWVVSGALLFLLTMLVALDLYSAHRRWSPVGRRVVTWTRHYPLWAAVFAGVFGAMIGHFFWKA